MVNIYWVWLAVVVGFSVGCWFIYSVSTCENVLINGRRLRKRGNIFVDGLMVGALSVLALVIVVTLGVET